jgi:nucleotide-binding universal stress UspA family protein
MASDGRQPRVVVGYDGSKCAQLALAWAADYAEQCDGALEIMTVWHWPANFGYPIGVADYHPDQDARRSAQDAAARSTLPPDRVTIHTAEGPAAARLVEHSRGARALVVGTRGHNNFSTLMLGSVSNHCAHRGECTVVIVRDTDSIEEGERTT